jgi:hypothetical protein
MDTRLAIRSPRSKIAMAHSDIPMGIPSDQEVKLNQALELALQARAADEAGDRYKAACLRAEHDTIFMEIERCLPQQK